MCEHKRRLDVGGKVSDMCHVTFIATSNNLCPEMIEHDGYVPRDLGIGGGDYLDMTICLDCKQVVGMPTLSDEDVVQALTGR